MKLMGTAMVAIVMMMAGGCSKNDTSTAVAVNNSAMAPVDEPTMSAPTASAGQTFANAAAASDAFEIETSRLALANANSTAIKTFAQKMVDGHTASTEKLKAAASSGTPAITPDPTLTAEQRAQVDGMKVLKGAAFDQAYVTAQRDGHQKTLDTLKAYAASGDVPALKSFAAGLVPTVTAHLNMAKSLKP